MSEWADLSGLKQPDSSGGQSGKRINCFKCQHFRVSWDPKYPRSCLVFGFSGPEMPSETVRKATGRDCPAFSPKQTP